MLKIDLLPKHFRIARTNKRILTIGIMLLVVVGGGFWLKYKAIRGEIVNVEQAIAQVQPIATEVGELETEISEKQGWLDPIQAKLVFVENADKTGDDYFDRFHSINDYIWKGAQMSSFSITSGGGVAGGVGGVMGPGMRGPGMGGPGTAQPTGGTASTVQFTVEVRGDAGVGRFLLNLLRCPDLTNITYSGVPGGRSITAAGAGAAMTATAGPLGMPSPGMFAREDRGPGYRGPGMRGPGGMPPATSQDAGVEPGSPNEPITLQISAILTEPITVPTPPGQAAVAAGIGVGGLMGPGMTDPGMRVPRGSGAAAGGADAGGLSEEESELE